MSTKTTNLKLTKPDPGDYYNVKDFNDNADIIDAAVGTLRENVKEMSDVVFGKTGILRFQTGSYVGTGTYGEDNPCTLNFDFNPMVLLITRQGNTSQCDTRFVYPADSADDLNGQYMVVTWGEKSVSWHAWEHSSNEENGQNNNAGQIYYWVAFGYED